MSDIRTAMHGAFECISEEALPTVSSSTQIFANCPDNTVLILLTIRTVGLTMRFDGNAATAGANGIDYKSDSYEITISKSNALKVRAIQNGGTATGYISYFKAA